MGEDAINLSLRLWQFISRYRAYIVLGLLIASVIGAEAHSWYPSNCCSDGDCFPISCEGIMEPTDTKDGWYHWMPQPGDKWYEFHPKEGFMFAPDHVFPSQDAHCHACVFGEPQGGGSPMCLFIQQGS